jgi:DNA-binding MarR family transcriptional regulator
MRSIDDPRFRAFGLLIEAHAGLTGVLGRELEDECGLPLAWYEVLLRLGHAAQRRLRMTELAESVALSASGLTRLVDRMEAAGLVCRERCPSDRRGAFAVLTDEGATRLEAATVVHVRGIEEHFLRHLSESELERLTVILEKLRTPTRGEASVCGIAADPVDPEPTSAKGRRSAR